MSCKKKGSTIVITAAKYSEVLGLQRVLKVGVGLAYKTSVNIKIDDGLINGATCILKKIHYFKSNASKHPDILWVHLHDETVGKLWRQKYSAYYNEGIGKTRTPIFWSYQAFCSFKW